MAQGNRDFSQSSMSKNIIAMAVPMTMAQLVNVLYSVVDRMYIGHIEGTGALALTGLGIALPAIALILAFANLCGTGGGALCAIYRGKGDEEEASKVIGNSMTLLLIFGIAIPLLFLPFIKPLLYFFGASDVTYTYAFQYTSIYLLGTPFVMISLGMNPFINAQGFGRIGMLTVALGAAVNLVLDPIFIFAFGLGIRGAAVATVIAQACSALWVLKFIAGDEVLLRLRLSHMKLEGTRVKKIITLGLSGFSMALTNCLVQVVCNKTLYAYGGDLYVGVMTVANAIREVTFMVIQGLNYGSQPVIGFNYGAGLYSRVRAGTRFVTAVTFVYALLVWALMMTWPETVFRLFSSEDALITAGVPALRIYFSMYIVYSLQIVGQTVFLSLGRSRYAIFFALFRKAIINAPLTVILAMLIGTSGVFWAEAISQLVGGIACMLTMYFTVYRPMGKIPDRIPDMAHR